MPESIDKLIDELEKWSYERRITRAELAKSLGVTRQAVYNWLSRKRVPSGEQVLAIQELIKKQRGK